MFTRPRTVQRIVCCTGGLLKAACLGLASIALLCSAQQAQADAKAEYDLVSQINLHRMQKGLAAIPLSQKMTTVAKAHVEDLANNEPHKKLCPADPDKQNGHSWSHNPGKWKGGCYDYDNQATYSIMWDKPKEITGYPTDGYEIFTTGTSANGALQSWKDSALHNDVILNKNTLWSGFSWTAIGAASYKGYYVVWFGKTLDTSKAPNKIARLKDYDKPKTVGSMGPGLAIDPARLAAAKAKSASEGAGSGKGDATKIAPSGSRVSEGVHGRVYALDESGKIIGNVSGATIEVKNQAGAVVATITSAQHGYYKADLSPGQYFYKVTAPGYKDEDKGRGFTLQRNDRGHIYDFWLVKGPNDPNKKPPKIPTAEIGNLKGHVWETTVKGELLGIPQAAISLRRSDSTQLAKVLTRGADEDGELAGFYEVVLQTGSWRASVQAPGFKMLVDPKPIAIDAGKETTRDFILQRLTQKPPTNQGIKGIVRVRGLRLGQLPADLKVEIKPVVSAMSNLGAVVVASTGGFRQELLPGSYRLQASAGGYRTADSGVKFVFPGKYTMVDLLLAVEQTPEQPEDPGTPDETDKPTEIHLMLTVVEDSKRGRQPLPGAKLLVRRSNQALDEAQRGTADESGKVEFLLGQPGPYVALAQAEGFKPSGIKLEIAPAANLSRTITLSRSEIEQDPGLGDEHEEEAEPVKVSGYLVRNDKKSSTGAFGVPGASLTWNRIGGPGGRPQRVSTGTVGNFDLVLPEGDYRLGFDLPQGFQPKGPELVKVRVGMDKKWFFALKAPQRVPDDGGARPGAPVRPEESEPVEFDVRGAVVVQSARVRGGYAGVSGAVVRWHPQSGSHTRPGTAHSGSGGAFSLRLGTGVYTVEVMPPPGYQRTTKVVRVHPGMERTLLVLGRASNIPDDTGKPPKEPGNLTLTLQVFGRDGRRAFPLGAAQIQISGRRQMFMTDKRGRLSVPLPAGRYDVTATKSGYNMARRQVVLSGRNTVVPPIYLDRQPTGGGGEIRPPGDGQTPPPPQKVPLQIRVMVTFPKPAKRGQPAGSTTLPAKGANIRIMHGRQQVFAGRADGNGYLGTHLPPGNYQIQVAHGNLNHNEAVTIGKQVVRRIITLQSGAALMTPGPTKPIPRIPNRGPLIPKVPLQRRVL
ncbi:MAG TPA: hypothetical protein ENH84_07540 [Phycisphaerae bacterium]|nr:hypothetical protein [Phycisphaerae bacterium]